MKSYFQKRGPFAPKADMRRLAITTDLCCDMRDPRNARYLRPLSIVADEDEAHAMASVVYCSIADDLANDPGFDSDRVYLQCLVNARRMLRDIEYWSLFDRAENFTHHCTKRETPATKAGASL